MQVRLCNTACGTESVCSVAGWRRLERSVSMTERRFVTVNVLVTEIQKHLLAYRPRRGGEGCEEAVERDLLALLGHFRAKRMGLKEFCARLRVLVGAAVLMATVKSLKSGQAAVATSSPMAHRKDTFKECPGKRPLESEVASAPAPVATSTAPLKKHRTCTAATPWAIGGVPVIYHPLALAEQGGEARPWALPTLESAYRYKSI